MTSTNQLIALADAYKRAAGIERDQTVSYRVFGDSKKLAALRGGAGITLDRFNASIMWFRENWPKGQRIPRGVLFEDHTSPDGSTPLGVQAPRKRKSHGARP